MGPSKNSPLPNPFFLGSNAKSPRSSISGKDSLGRIPSITSLKNTVDKINSPARRVSSALLRTSSENEKPTALQLGKHYYSHEELSNLEGTGGGGFAPSSKRKSPRKLSKIKQSGSDVMDVDSLLAVQKTLFKLRTKITELTDVGDLVSSHHWLTIVLNDTSMKCYTHWSDHYRFFKSCIAQRMPVKLILEAVKRYEADSKVELDIHLKLLKADLMSKEGLWDELLVLISQLDLDSVGFEFERVPVKNWEREQFPAGWVPTSSSNAIKARFYHFLGLAHRNQGSFEKAIDAFDQSTQFDSFIHVTVTEMIYESNALIPAGQRQQYLETLALGEAKYYSLELESQFNSGRYAKVLSVTRPYFSEPRNLLNFDHHLLVMHLGCLSALKLSDELFVLAHTLVENFPQRAISWYAVGLYYESIGRFDDGRRYLMKSCSTDETFGPAWLMLGHSFSRSGDHDQAVSAYALLARHTAPASIYPRMFLAMEFLKAKQIQSARMYLTEAFQAEKTNACIMNEIGVLYTLQMDSLKAIRMFYEAYNAYKRENLEMQSSNEVPVSILSNLLVAYFKFFPEARNLALEVNTAYQQIEELVKIGGNQLPLKTLVICGAIAEIKAALIEENAELYGRAADFYHAALLQSKHDRMALEGYNRCLIAKVQNSELSPQSGLVSPPPPPLCSSSDEDEMAIDTDMIEDPPVLRTPVKPHLVDVESSPISTYSEQLTASRPPTLRRRLTSLSFTQLDADLDSD